MLYHGWSAIAPERKAKLSKDSRAARLLVEALEDRLALTHSVDIVVPPAPINEGALVQFSSVVQNAEGTVSYSWLVTDSSNVQVATGSVADFSFTPSDAGAYKVILTATDTVAEVGHVTTDEVNLDVANVIPQGLEIIGPANVVRGQSVTYTAGFASPGPDTFTYAWTVTQNGEPVTFDNTTPSSITFAPSADGVYVVSVTVTDDDGGVSGPVTRDVTVSAVALQGADLVVGGTTGDDNIVFTPAPIKSTTPGGKGKPAVTGKTTMGVKVLINGVSQGVFQPMGSIIAMGQEGNDNIQVAGGIRLNTLLLGGVGNDRLNGGNGKNVLVGGDGDDRLIGGNKNDVLIGGAGSDRLNGGAGQDILVAGSTSADADTTALALVLTQWTTTDSYATRIATLSGAGTALRLGGATITDDGVVDHLHGAAHLDWFFTGETTDKITGKLKGETLNNPIVTP